MFTQIKIYLTIAIIAAAIGWHFYDRHQAYNSGVMVERMAWERAKSELLAKQAAERKAAQAKIAEIEKSYLSKLTNKDAAYSDLEAALDAERIDAEKADAVAIARNKPGEETPSCVCVRPPAISERLRDQLQKARP